MAQSRTVSKRIRFEVFKRDAFTCQYCGRSAPDIILDVKELHIDHIEPVAGGGSNDILNLVTSCEDCNLGKGAARLSDNAAVTKSMSQLKEVNAKREQLQLLVQWKKELEQFQHEEIQTAANHWQTLTKGYGLNENGLTTLKSLIRSHSIANVLDAMERSTEIYLVLGKEGVPSQESIELAFGKVTGVLRVERAAKTKPYLKRYFYTRGILRNRKVYCNDRILEGLFRDYHSADLGTDPLEALAKTCRSWTEFRESAEANLQKEALDDTAAENFPLDAKADQIHPDSVEKRVADLSNYLIQKFRNGESELRELAGGLDFMCSWFQQFLRDNEEEISLDGSPELVYTLLRRFVHERQQSETLYCGGAVATFGSFDLGPLNDILESRLDSHVPYFYYAESIERIGVLEFPTRRFHLRFREHLSTQNVGDGGSARRVLENSGLSGPETEWIIHSGIIVVLEKEFEQLGVPVSKHFLHRVLKYFDYRSVFPVVDWYSEEEAGLTDAQLQSLRQDRSIEDILSLLFRFGDPNWTNIAREGNVDEYMNLFVGTYLGFESARVIDGQLRIQWVHNWQEYLKSLDSDAYAPN